MKRILLLSSIAVFMLSCKKEAITPNATNTSPIVNSKKLVVQDPTSKSMGQTYNEAHFDVGGHFIFCGSQGYGCMQPVTVTPNKVNTVNHFGDLIRNGNAALDSAVFANGKAWLLSFMESADFDSVVNFTYTVDVKDKVSPTTDMYIILQNSTAEIKVYPLSE